MDAASKWLKSSGTTTPKRDATEVTGVSHSELSDLLAKHANKERELAAETMSSFVDKSQKASMELLDGFAKATEARFAKNERDISQNSNNIEELRGKQDKNDKEIKELQDALRIANDSSLTRDMLVSSKFDRPPNIEIIKISSGKFVSKISVENAIRPWLDECEICPTIWKLMGSSPNGKQFYIQFLQNSVTAGKLVEELLPKLKDDNGDWKVFKAITTDKKEAQLHIGRDENNKTRTQRRMQKAFISALEACAPQLEEVHYRFYNQAVFSGRSDGIARMEPKAETVKRADFEWNYEAVTRLALDKEAILDKTLELLARPADSIQWSV
jgi:hypothetical protein